MSKDSVRPTCDMSLQNEWYCSAHTLHIPEDQVFSNIVVRMSHCCGNVTFHGMRTG